MPIPTEAIAAVCHEANRAYCLTLGDSSQYPWGAAPEWQRLSAVNGVQAIIDNPDMTPEGSHENWLAEKEADGWTWGEVKDAGKKVHPCFMPYSMLPTDQKVKDVLFQAVARALLA